MKKIAIINTLPIPSGNASVNRFLSYSKGLVELGHQVTILSSAQNDIAEIELDGVKCYNLGTKYKFSLLIALLRILKNILSSEYDFIILVSNSLLLIYPIALISKITGIKLLQEKSEFPFVLMKNGMISKIKAAIYVNTTYRLFDGLIVMTKPLMKYFQYKVSSKCKMIEIPMTVDFSRFQIKKEKTNFGEYIAYCGNMSGNKDGIYNLIDSFYYIEKARYSIKLLMIGGTNKEEEFDAIKKYVKELDLKNVIFYGKASREEIPSLLVNAKILALARPSGLQSSGGFPTKLGEYLSTGNPIVVTSVGDIPLYLNTVNSYILRADDNEAFAGQIKSILDNYEEAMKKSVLGKKLAKTIFNSVVQAKRLSDYLNEF